MGKGGDGGKDLSEGKGRKQIKLSILNRKGDAMRKFMVCVMIFTLVFTGYCFSSPDVVRADKGLEIATVEEGTIDGFISLMEDAEVIDEVILSMEDGRLEVEEVENLANIIQEKVGINPDYDLYWCTYYCVRALICLITLQFDCFQLYLEDALVYCTLGL